MGKLVKYCGVCEEGFAERFGFCPNCGGELEAFELNPIAKKEAIVEENANDFVQPETAVPQTAAAETVVPETLDFSGDDILELDSVDTRETIIEKEPETFAATVPTFDSNEFHTEKTAASRNFSKTDANGEYHITVVSEKASNWFQPFLLGLLAFAFFGAIASYGVAIWIHGFQIPEIEGVDSFYSNLTEETPLEIEEIKKKNEEAGGGGGGGGNENPDPASKGRIPTHSDKPTPIMILPRMDSDIQVNNRVQDNIKKEDNGEKVGGGTGEKTSGGNGKGGGIGTGIGTGIGSGEGTGVGSGRGSGTGGGVGSGIGDGIGDGEGDNTPQVTKIEKKPVGETKGVVITSKPTPRYTDAARQNNVQGTVTLRVTFNANGTIGGVSPVNSLPNGLTEQAIAAAKQIRFQPAIRNGQAYAVTKQVVYSFTIY